MSLEGALKSSLEEWTTVKLEVLAERFHMSEPEMIRRARAAGATVFKRAGVLWIRGRAPKSGVLRTLARKQGDDQMVRTASELRRTLSM